MRPTAVGADGVFDQVVVDFEAAVMQVTGQSIVLIVYVRYDPSFSGPTQTPQSYALIYTSAGDPYAGAAAARYYSFHRPNSVVFMLGAE